MGKVTPTPPFLYVARNNNNCLEELGVPGGLNGVGIKSSVVQELVQIDFQTCADEYPFIHKNF